MEKKSFWWWVVFVILFIWQLPQALVGLIMGATFKKKVLVADRHYNFCWKTTEMLGGISLGPYAYVSDILGRHETHIAHETDGHSVDSKIFGPLYLLIIGLPSLLNAVFDFTDCYYDFYTEKWANKHAGLTTDDECQLIFKKDKSA